MVVKILKYMTKFGLYFKYKNENVSIPKSLKLEDINEDKCLELYNKKINK